MKSSINGNFVGVYSVRRQKDLTCQPALVRNVDPNLVDSGPFLSSPTTRTHKKTCSMRVCLDANVAVWFFAGFSNRELGRSPEVRGGPDARFFFPSALSGRCRSSPTIPRAGQRKRFETSDANPGGKQIASRSIMSSSTARDPSIAILFFFAA